MAEMIATRSAYGKTLAELGELNKDIVVLDADLAKSTYTKKFAEKFPERFFDMGVAEQNMISTAAGLAAAGKIPFASTFAIFASERACNQVTISVAYPALNVKIVATHAGVTVGEDGATHQALLDLAIMRAIPNMTVLVPADAVSTDRAVRLAAERYGPFYIRLGRSKVPVIYDENINYEIGKANILKDGHDVALIACGVMVSQALESADQLASEGIEARVIDMHSIKPLDEEAIINAAREVGAIVTAEEHNIIGGLGGAVAEVLVENKPVPMERIGVRDLFGQSGSGDDLLGEYGLKAQNIVEAAKRVIKRKERSLAIT